MSARELTRAEVDALPALAPWAHLVAGVFVGGCVAGPASFRRVAHAHTHGTLWRGWICVRAERRLSCRVLMLHELAHVTTGDGHSQRWRVEVIRLGGQLDAHPCGDLRDYHAKGCPRKGPAGGACGCRTVAPAWPATMPAWRDLVRPCCGMERFA